jgi:hypothetical protein
LIGIVVTMMIVLVIMFQQQLVLDVCLKTQMETLYLPLVMFMGIEK